MNGLFMMGICILALFAYVIMLDGRIDKLAENLEEEGNRHRDDICTLEFKLHDVEYKIDIMKLEGAEKK